MFEQLSHCETLSPIPAWRNDLGAWLSFIVICMELMFCAHVHKHMVHGVIDADGSCSADAHNIGNSPIGICRIWYSWCLDAAWDLVNARGWLICIVTHEYGLCYPRSWCTDVELFYHIYECHLYNHVVIWELDSHSFKAHVYVWFVYPAKLMYLARHLPIE